MALPFSTSALRPLEFLINRGIEPSATARAMAVALEGRSLEVRLDGTPVRLQLAAAGGTVRVRPAGEADGRPPADATLSGSPVAMLRLLAGDPQALIREGDVAIAGDTDVANQFRDLLHMARPDLEEELSRLVGDPLAHRLAGVARELADFGVRATASLSRSVSEYLTEERRTLPTRAEAEEFYRDVDRTANDVERVEARLARLRNRQS
ncbi:MAG: SCP2 sterol-binding domain-containing protein [Gammaproteobacteria bacterium]|nr:SCP2 sterol-binding domain-containing protein [Gammaproteobacteria bacterium]